MGNRIATRSQLIGTLKAIYDFATVGSRATDLDWTAYQSVSVGDLSSVVLALAETDIRVKNLFRDVKRKHNYEALKEGLQPMVPAECTEFYYKTWWQIDVNQMVENRRTEFGVDVEEFAKMISGTLNAVVNYESFHDLISDRALIHAFKETADIPVKHKDEFRRKFRRAYKSY